MLSLDKRLNALPVECLAVSHSGDFETWGRVCTNHNCEDRDLALILKHIRAIITVLRETRQSARFPADKDCMCGALELHVLAHFGARADSDVLTLVRT
jgi:hypothetical protein